MGTATGHALIAAVAAALTLGVLAGPASAAPKRPSDTQVQQAQAAADAVAAQISALSAELSDAQATVDKAQVAAAIALEDYQAKQAQGALQQQAADALTVAQDAERAARQQATEVQAQQAGLQQQLDQAQGQLVEVVGEQQAADRVAAQLTAAPKPATSSNADPVVRTEAGPGSTSAAQAAIDAAMTQLGVPYSWSGGGTNGPATASTSTWT